MLSNNKIYIFIKTNAIFFIVLSCLTIFSWLFFFTYFAVPFFKLLCQDTGPNGVYGLFLDLKKYSLIFQFLVDYFTIIKNKLFWFNGELNESNNISDLKKLRFVNISIVFKINDSLPLDFNTNIVKHRVSVGLPQLTFCTVKNNLSQDIIFTSIYNIYPSEALPHLEKIQCFCYDDQLVEAHSTLYLPIYYRLSPTFFEDPLMVNVTDLTISYSIFSA